MQLRGQLQQEQSAHLYTLNVPETGSFQRSYGRRFTQIIPHTLQYSLCPVQVLKRTAFKYNDKLGFYFIWTLIFTWINC